MYAWGPRSKKILTEIHEDLQLLCTVTLDLTPFDLTLTDGHRGEKLQEQYFNSGASKVEYPDSLHNKLPSMAVHLHPLPLDQHEYVQRYYILAGVVFAAARRLGLEERIRWGGLWDRPWLAGLEENPFKDLSHVELLE